MHIATGGILIALLNYKEAHALNLHSGDRILIKDHPREVTCILDITKNSKVVPEGKIGLFEEVLKRLKLNHNSTVSIKITGKPESIRHIHDKLMGKHLSYEDLYHIISDITHDRLTDIEKTYFVAACYTKGLDVDEVVNLTKAMVDTGEKLKFKGIVIDKHSIGGIPGNRTTMVVVPIIAAAGFIVPKTSSRAITSPAGTADTMECLAQVDLPEDKIRKIVNKIGACIVHGGAINLAPADDKIIEVEHPLSVDAEGQMLASVMAKKYSVGATHVLIDIPVGKTAKSENCQDAFHLKHMFELIGKKLGLKVKVIMTNGTEPIGNGVGPLLEAEDVLKVLRNEADAPIDLKIKSVVMAGTMLEMTGKIKNGFSTAKEILESGKALKKMNEIIAAQGKVVKPYLGKYHYEMIASVSGKVKEINNKIIAKISRAAGAPDDKGAGMYLYKKTGDVVQKGEKLYTIYAYSKTKLDLVVACAKENKGYVIK